MSSVIVPRDAINAITICLAIALQQMRAIVSLISVAILRIISAMADWFLLNASCVNVVKIVYLSLGKSSYRPLSS
jgi:hypothetical protein